MENIEGRIKWIAYKGIQILFSDYTNLQGDDQTNAIRESERKSLSAATTNIYAMHDVHNSAMSPEATAAAKHWEKACQEKGKKLILTIVGITGAKRVIAQAVKRDIYFAKDIDDAKEWLVKQAEKTNS